MENFGTLPVLNEVVLNKKMLTRAYTSLVYDKFGKKIPMPSNAGTSMRVIGVESLPINTNPLVSGVNPTSTAITQKQVSVELKQYGAWASLDSFLMDHEATGRLMDEVAMVLGENAAQTMDVVTASTLRSGTNVRYVSGSTRGGLTASNIITLATLKLAARDLEKNAVPYFNGTTGEQPSQTTPSQFFKVLMSPQAFHDLTLDSEFKAWSQGNSNSSYYSTGSVVRVLNFEIHRTSHAPVFAGEGAGGVDVHGILMFGRDSFAVLEPSGDSLKMIYRPAKDAGGPLEQYATQGWKATHASVILYNDRMVRIEAGVTA
jgi:N4-gp56 family major capsid protein